MSESSDAHGQIRLAIVDDHRMVRMGLASILQAEPGMTIVGEARDGAEALELLMRVDVDVVLMDLSMPVMDGVAATRRLREQRPDVRVVVLTSSTEQKAVRAAVAAGAIGYALKDSAPEDLVAAVHSAAHGHSPLDPRIAGALLPSADVDPASTLSGRETEVLLLVTKGLANKQIGRSLGISERTVKVHLGNVFRRIGVADRTSAALWARDNLLGTP